MIPRNEVAGRGFPMIAGIFLGLGLGGFFDGIILHQVLQWHHMFTSAGFPIDSLGNLEFNVMWDGFFHIATYVFTLTGMIILWRKASQPHDAWSWTMMAGAMIWGALMLAGGWLLLQVGKRQTSMRLAA